MADLFSLSGFDLDPEALRRVPRALALKFNVLPLRVEHEVLTVAVPDETDREVFERLRLATGQRVRMTTAPVEVIRRHLETAWEVQPRSEASAAAPAVSALDAIHERALQLRASDIHLEPAGNGGRVRHRVDGVLQAPSEIAADVFAPLISRVKLLAGMDIADRRQPQDGRYAFASGGKSIDARVSCVPTIAGEKLVVRLLDHQVTIPALEHLGLRGAPLERFRRSVHAAHGFVVICGPTGSGKTTTLYAAISERNTAGQSICSVEDPVEVRIPGVAQVQINARAGMTFASAVRAFLRQDPNVVTIGEMRDAETASAGLSAALSGHLVATTLHSSNALGTIHRLLDLGLDRYAVASGLTAVVAQRLVRRTCAQCRLGANVRDTLFDDTPERSCRKCGGSGFAGRTGIFEVLSVDDEMRDLIAGGASPSGILKHAIACGFETMADDARAKVALGVTTVSETQRVLGVHR